MEEIKEELKKIEEILIEKVNPLAIVLFGSYSRNTQNKESDIDIAIKAGKMDKRSLFQIKQELEEATSKDIDLISLDDTTSDSLKYEILMSGITIYCKDSYKFDMYKMDMFREYFEYREGVQNIINRVKDGGTIYGK